MNLKAIAIAATAVAALASSVRASASTIFVLYTDSGVGWVIGMHDHEMQRAQIEADYAHDVAVAKDDYNAAVDAANYADATPEARQELMLAAEHRLEDDLQAAEDRRIALLDSIYPHRWRDFSHYPELVFVGYSGPCHFCQIDIEEGDIVWGAFWQPYPGFMGSCPFGWRWGEHHQFTEFAPARAAYRARFLAGKGARPRSAADVVFRTANRWVQTHHRSDTGHPQRGDINFLSQHQLQPQRPNHPTPPRAPVHPYTPRGASRVPPPARPVKGGPPRGAGASRVPPPAKSGPPRGGGKGNTGKGGGGRGGRGG